MEYSLGDLIDRQTILVLKRTRLDMYGFAEEQRAVDDAIAAMMTKIPQAKAFEINQLWSELRVSNAAIWDLEADIRQGKEGMLGLEEVGKRAVAIRDINLKRVEAKNKINQISGTGYQDRKSTAQPR